jgi:hypothetical protein
MQAGRANCPTTGSWVKWAAWLWTARITFGFCSGRVLTRDELGASLTPQRSQCCVAAPPVLVFDAQGNLLQSWGGPGEGFDWPKTEHGIYVDKDDNVWIGGSAPTDRHLLKFKSDGHFLSRSGTLRPTCQIVREPTALPSGGY